MQIPDVVVAAVMVLAQVPSLTAAAADSPGGLAGWALAAVLTGLLAIFRLRESDRKEQTIRTDAERDRAILDRDLARKESEHWKTEWKSTVESMRKMRRGIEADELGKPSVPPAPAWADETGQFRIDAEADRAWQEQRERDRRQRAIDVEVERYAKAQEKTRPEPLPPMRPRAPSRRD